MWLASLLLLLLLLPLPLSMLLSVLMQMQMQVQVPVVGAWVPVCPFVASGLHAPLFSLAGHHARAWRAYTSRQL